MTAKRTEPTRGLLQGGVYVPSNLTDIRKTWARFAPKPADAKVQPIPRKKA